MNVSSSMQNSYVAAQMQNLQNQNVQSQSMQSPYAPVASGDSDGDHDNDSAEQSSVKLQESASAGFNSQSIFSALNQNGSKGVSTDQLLNALTKQSSQLNANKNITQSNNLQSILMDKILSSYDTSKTQAQNTQVLSA